MYPDPHMHDPPGEAVPATGKPGEWDRADLTETNRINPRVFRWAAGIGICVIVMYLGNGLYHAVLNAREAARKSSSICSLGILGSSYLNYESANGELPPHTTTDSAGTPLHGWYTQLLPYLEQSALYSRIDLKKAWDHPDNAPLFRTRIGSICYCGVDPDVDPRGFPLTTYSANSRILQINTGSSFNEITDGLTNTILIGEISEALPPWGKPRNVRDPALGLKRGPDTFGGPFQGVTQFGFADGSATAISNDIDPKILKVLSTPAAGDETDWSRW